MPRKHFAENRLKRPQKRSFCSGSPLTGATCRGAGTVRRTASGFLKLAGGHPHIGHDPRPIKEERLFPCHKGLEEIQRPKTICICILFLMSEMKADRLSVFGYGAAFPIVGKFRASGVTEAGAPPAQACSIRTNNRFSSPSFPQRACRHAIPAGSGSGPGPRAARRFLRRRRRQPRPW